MDCSKGNRFLAKSLKRARLQAYVHAPEPSEQAAGAHVLRVRRDGPPRISFPADSRSSAGWDQHAQGRGLNTVKADPDLARRQSRLTRSGSAMSAEYRPQL